MSYEKVKTIKIKDNKVFINCASNNVIPLYYIEEEYPYLSKILQEQGEEALDIELLKAYEEGNLQQGINKYTRALKVLQYVFSEEYKCFDWREHKSHYGTEEYKNERKLRESKEFKDLLKKALEYKLPKAKFIISKNDEIYGNQIYIKKITTRRAFFTSEINNAKRFYFKEEAERVRNIFRDNENLRIIEVD